MKKLITILFLFLPLTTFAAAFEQITVVTSSGTSQTVNTHNHTDGQLLVAGQAGSNANVTSITWGGTAMSQVSSISCGDGHAAFYFLDDAAGGSLDLVITRDVAISSGGGVFVMSFSASDMNSTVATTTACGGSTSSSLAITTTGTNSLVIDALQISSGECCTLTVGADQTARRNVGSGGAGPDGISEEADGAPSSVTMSWTWDGSNRSRAHVVAEILNGTDNPTVVPTTAQPEEDILIFSQIKKFFNWFISKAYAKW